MILKWNRNSSREQDNHLLKPDNDSFDDWNVYREIPFFLSSWHFFKKHVVVTANRPECLFFSSVSENIFGGMQQVLQVFPRQYPTFCHVCSSPTATSPFFCKKLWTLMIYFITCTLQNLIISQNSKKICKAVASIKLSKTYLA